ncbi:glycoside hydrolase family 43 protein [Flagellimonas iocasae]|uniref:Glycoside hydrolase family 43 protein n=1 Tax=Flagellimonas iocasae TaxID=2055905 RepID=A0ABW4XYD8_9FLAO
MKKRILAIVAALFGILAATAQIKKEKSGYLFTYFTGNSVEEESIHFAVSPDGFHYYALNENKPVLDSKKISSTGGVRDPHILQGEDGNSFYMVVTDMTSHLGWDSNRGMVLLKSNDLVNWRSSVVNIQKRFNGHEDLKRVWAPQTIYDKKEGKYMVYFSMKHGTGPDIIYYAYTNDDFTDLICEPKQLFFPKNGKSCIDGDIIEKDGVYHLFYKTEGHGNGIKHATTQDLTSGDWLEEDDYKQQTSELVEGSSIFKLNNSDTYILLYDMYTKGSYQFTSSTDLKTFEIIDDQISMDFHPRHGTVLPITKSELELLFDKWGKPMSYQN